jgi:hypothetical protein
MTYNQCYRSCCPLTSRDILNTSEQMPTDEKVQVLYKFLTAPTTACVKGETFVTLPIVRDEKVLVNDFRYM